MSGFTMQFTGLNELQRGLIERSHLEAAKTVVAKNGSRLQTWAKVRAPVDTGTLKRSIGLEMQHGGLTAEVKATAHYSGYVERGTRFMAAQPYMKPVFNVIKRQFDADLRKLVR